MPALHTASNEFVPAMRVSAPRVRDVSAGGVQVISAAEGRSRYILLTGSLLTPAIVELPRVAGASWAICNRATLGLLSVSVRAAGSSVLLAVATGTLCVWCDGQDLIVESALGR